ncbi:hypothetical protein [Pseudanabaena sp. UWO310]|nr:hypothetical protein [Pseudanabaena sp. UWO310]
MNWDNVSSGQFATGFEEGFATQTLPQSPTVKALLCKAFTVGL